MCNILNQFLLSHQTVLWCSTEVKNVPSKIPYVIDVCPETFSLLDELLSLIFDGPDGNLLAFSFEKECIAVACLNLLKLQVIIHIIFHVLIFLNVT